ncbi:transmembrane protein 221 [Salminus brasiliensis]|uniref:transmembrane protein 221 n=1 Tax=Salminus brasiliensis TaxID=930266 RepID=UPI003B82D1DF
MFRLSCTREPDGEQGTTNATTRGRSAVSPAVWSCCSGRAACCPASARGAHRGGRDPDFRTAMSYSQRALVVLALLGVLSAVMSVLSVFLIFQLQARQGKDSPSVVSSEVSAVLMPVSVVLSALSLTLNSSSVIVCLLHSYLSTEICRGGEDTQRADWFLLDSRAVRHVAIGLFCLGISVYLGAMGIYMLLVFEIETGIASACVLSSGVLVLLVIVAHSLFRAARTARRFRNQHVNTVYQNDPESSPAVHTSELNFREKPRRQLSQASIHRQYPYTPSTEPKQQYSPSSGPHSYSTDREAYNASGSGRMHRTLSAESGLLQAQTKPWNGVNNEMRTVLARKATSKDSTLV